ncbi:hypothetical protein [Streptomyces sp. NPDC126933]|uniref:hypothetical protein n=1 Tax=unclassified Streptomyces TaxID=2593676 RepID=UPI00364666C9
MTDPVSPAPPVDRRRVLVTGLGVAGGATLWASGMSGLATAAESAESPESAAAVTDNGWPVVERPESHRVEGAGSLTVPVLDGDVATVLLHVLRRFHYEITTLDKGEVTGHTITSQKITEPYESNYRSGTAVAILPGMYPVGAKGGFFPNELTVIRDILADCEGVVRWGGDEKVPKEGHFEIAVKPGDARLARTARKIAAWGRAPGEGAGSIDATASERRRAAKALERRQKAA